jgi:hypothetical protein
MGTGRRAFAGVAGRGLIAYGPHDCACHAGVLRADRTRMGDRAGARPQQLPPKRRGEQPEPRCDQPGGGPVHQAARGGNLCGGLLGRRAMGIACRPVVGVGDRDRRLRLLLLLEPPARSRECDLLGRARRAPPEPGVQPLHRTAPDEFRRVARLDLLPAHGHRRHPPRSIRGLRRRQSPLPVLDSHRADRKARLVRPLVQLALQPPRAPRGQRSLHRPQLRRHLHGLGSPVRHLRRRGREVRVRDARPSRLVGPAVGEPRGLCRPRPTILAG